MIRSFANKATEDVFNGEFTSASAKKLPREILRRAWIVLHTMDSTSRLDDLKVPPGNRLKQLSGRVKARWSVRLNDQWRMTFLFKDGEFSEVLIVDYH